MATRTARQVFGQNAGRLEEFRIGETHGVAAKLSKMARAVNRNTSLLDPPNTIDRLLIPTVRMFKLKAPAFDSWDAIFVNTWDGTTQGSETIIVLKPWFLRGFFWSNSSAPARLGITYSQFANGKRTASKDGESDETQWIIPQYAAGDVIFAISNIYGGIETETVQNVFSDARWMDLNIDGRMWAQV